MKRHLSVIFLLLLVAIWFGVVGGARAEDAIGDKCDRAGERKKICAGGAVATLSCARPDGVADNCYYNPGTVSVGCSFVKDPVGDQCADNFKAEVKICLDIVNSCAAACSDASKICAKSCSCDPALGSLYQCSFDYDAKYKSCVDACGATEETCRSNCFNNRSACIGSARDKYTQCDKNRLRWKKISESECPAGTACEVQGSGANCESSSEPKVKTGADGFLKYLIPTKYSECMDAVDKEFGLDPTGPCKGLCRAVYGCYSPGQGYGVYEDCVARKAPQVKAAWDKCKSEDDDAKPEPSPVGDPGGTEDSPPLEQARTLDGDPLRDFLYKLSLSDREELFTEENRQIIGVEQWVKLVKADENIRELERNARDMAARDYGSELRLYLDSNNLAEWERAVVEKALERAKNQAPNLPEADFFPEPPAVADYRSRSREDYADEVARRDQEAGRQIEKADREYQKTIDALNKELGVSPLRQGLRDMERAQRDAAAEYDKPDPSYTGFDYEVPYDSTPEPDAEPPIVSGRGRNPSPEYRPPVQVGRISNYEGRVVIERTERDGSITRVQVRRNGTSIRHGVIFDGDRVLVGQDSAVDIVNPNGAENRYSAPELPQHPTGDDIDMEVKNTVIQPPDPTPPPPNPVFKSIRSFFDSLIPAGDEDTQTQITTPRG